MLIDTDHSSQNVAETLKSVLNEWNVLEKTSTIVTDNAAVMIKCIIAKCKKIVTYFKSSPIAYAKLKEAQEPEKSYSLIQEMSTRWNCSFAMIKRMLMLKDFVSSVLLRTSKALTPLAADDIAILKDLLKLFEPLTMPQHSYPQVVPSLSPL